MHKLYSYVVLEVMTYRRAQKFRLYLIFVGFCLLANMVDD